jgi:hypothetical protein
MTFLQRMDKNALLVNEAPWVGVKTHSDWQRVIRQNCTKLPASAAKAKEGNDKCGLHRLPLEIVLEIENKLDLRNSVALRLVSRALFIRLPAAIARCKRGKLKQKRKRRGKPEELELKFEPLLLGKKSQLEHLREHLQRTEDLYRLGKVETAGLMKVIRFAKRDEDMMDIPFFVCSWCTSCHHGHFFTDKALAKPPATRLCIGSEGRDRLLAYNDLGAEYSRRWHLNLPKHMRLKTTKYAVALYSALRTIEREKEKMCPCIIQSIQSYNFMSTHHRNDSATWKKLRRERKVVMLASAGYRYRCHVIVRIRESRRDDVECVEFKTIVPLRDALHPVRLLVGDTCR